MDLVIWEAEDGRVGEEMHIRYCDIILCATTYCHKLTKNGYVRYLTEHVGSTDALTFLFKKFNSLQ